MAEKFVKYRSLNDKAFATEICGLLASHDIPFQWESTEGYFDASFTHNEILDLYYIKLRPGDFRKADELLMNLVVEKKEEPTGDYYLLSFSTEELKDVLSKPDEWNEFDRYWAKKILASRGVEIGQEELERAAAERLAELKKPWTLDNAWLLCILAVWLVAFWFAHFFASVAVIFIGGYIGFSKKTMPDGERVEAFSAKDRRLGRMVLIAGIALLILLFLQYYGFIEFISPL